MRFCYFQLSSLSSYELAIRLSPEYIALTTLSPPLSNDSSPPLSNDSSISQMAFPFSLTSSIFVMFPTSFVSVVYLNSSSSRGVSSFLSSFCCSKN